MKKISCAKVTIVGALASILALTVPSQAPSLPIFSNIGVQAHCAYDPGTQLYAYQYNVTNPGSNTIRIWTIDLVVDLSWPALTSVNAPDHWSSRVNEGKEGTHLCPPAAYVTWCTSSTMPNMPEPGTTAGPFSFSIAVPPGIQECWVNPRLHLYFQAFLQATGEDEFDPDEQESIEGQYIRKIQTLGPLGVFPNTFQHWDKFLTDVAKCGQLGWISDSALLAGIQSDLSAARQAALAQNQTLVSAKLQAVVGAIQASTPSQRTDEGYALVFYNAQYLQQYLPWPCEPKLTLAPSSAMHALGEKHTATAKLVNVANGLPLAGNYIEIRVTEGPHAGQRLQGTTAADGTFTFAYTGTKAGVDTLQANTGMGTIHEGATKKAPGNGRGTGPARQGKSASNCTAESTYSDPVKVTWSGGPDLEVIGFIPPVLTSAPGRTFYITETTMNSGNLPAGPSTTRYYLATSSPVDPATALVVGERTVPALAPGERSSVESVPYVIPASLPAGNYFLDACADAANKVAETNEGNNCASSRVQVMGGAVPTNRPPDCTKAVASPAPLWPPNHKPKAKESIAE